MFSTRTAAKKLGLNVATLSRYITSGKISPPAVFKVGGASLHAWTEEDIKRARQLLPTIADGRKTRWQKQKTKSKAQPRTTVPQKQSKPKAKSKH